MNYKPPVRGCTHVNPRRQGITDRQTEEYTAARGCSVTTSKTALILWTRVPRRIHTGIPLCAFLFSYHFVLSN